MTRLHRSIFLGLGCALVVLSGCSASKREINAAKHSLYDTDFAVVYSAALDATREHYPTLDDNPGPGKIATAWHQVQFSNCAASGSTCDDAANALTLNNASAPTQSAAGAAPTQLVYKRYFIRFDVTVTGGRPWHVKVVGHASEWDPGAAMPVEMHGANKPPWLDPRTDALRVAIYKRIKQYAIPMKDEEAEAKPEEEPKTDPATFKGVPAGAAKRLAEIKDALTKRDYAALRPQLADDVVWSLGGGSGADAAMAMWQADPDQLDAMMSVLTACTAESPQKVACPAGSLQPGQFQLVIEARGDAWKVTSFVKNE